MLDDEKVENEIWRIESQENWTNTTLLTVLLNGYPATRTWFGVGLDELLAGLYPARTLQVLWVHLGRESIRMDQSY